MIAIISRYGEFSVKIAALEVGAIFVCCSCNYSKMDVKLEGSIFHSFTPLSYTTLPPRLAFVQLSLSVLSLHLFAIIQTLSKPNAAHPRLEYNHQQPIFL